MRSKPVTAWPMATWTSVPAAAPAPSPPPRACASGSEARAMLMSHLWGGDEEARASGPLRSLQAGECPELPRLSARDLHLRALAQLGVQRPVGARLDALDELQVEDLAAVGAEELRRVQAPLDCREAVRQQGPLLAPRQARRVALRGEQLHLAQRHEPAARPVADEQLLQYGPALHRSWRAGTVQALQRGGQAARVDRFQQVVEGIHLEGTHRVCIVRGREDDLRHVLEARQQVEAGAAGHLHVQEDQTGLLLLDHRPRLGGAAGLAAHLQPGMLGQQAPHLAARQGLVIHDHGLHGTIGRRTRATATSGRDRSSATLAPAPKISRSRSAELRSPVPPSARPAPAGRELLTASASEPSHTAASTRTCPPPGSSAMPCLMAFSTSVCSSMVGMPTVPASSVISYSTRSRSSSRSASMSR